MTFYFYPRPPRGGRRPVLTSLMMRPRFLSTPSARRATRRCLFFQRRRAISIHALREEGDRSALARSQTRAYFYPRPPRGGRHPAGDPCGKLSDFYPRPPRGGRPPASQTPPGRPAISIHALREEGDAKIESAGAAEYLISIHALREEGDVIYCKRLNPNTCISIHALREEGDRCLTRTTPRSSHFYPRPPRGGRLASMVTMLIP